MMTKASKATLPANCMRMRVMMRMGAYQCRLDWGAESVIKPARQRADGTRQRLLAEPDEREISGTERLWGAWAVESFFSALKRTMGSTLTHANQANCWPKPLSKCWPTPPPLGEHTSQLCFQQSNALSNHPLKSVLQRSRLAAFLSDKGLVDSSVNFFPFQKQKTPAIARGAFGVCRFISRADAGEFFVRLHVHDLELFRRALPVVRAEGQFAEVAFLHLDEMFLVLGAQPVQHDRVHDDAER